MKGPFESGVARRARSHGIATILVLVAVGILVWLSALPASGIWPSPVGPIVLGSDVFVAAGLLQLAHASPDRAKEIDALQYLRFWFPIWLGELLVTPLFVLPPLHDFIATLPRLVWQALWLCVLVIAVSGIGYALFLISELWHWNLRRMGLEQRWQRMIYLLDGKGINRWMAERIRRKHSSPVEMEPVFWEDRIPTTTERRKDR